MRWFSFLICFFAITCAGTAESLHAILGRMDATAPSFKGITATLRMVTHTAILNDDTTQNGLLHMRRLRPGETRALINFTDERDKHTVSFGDRTVKMYYPNLNLVQVYDLGKNAKLIDQYLLLGFGSSGKDLQNNYEIQDAGAESIQGRKTTKLQLIPKSKDAQERLAKAEIWFPEDADYPIQQKFYQPNGNFTLVTYSDFQLNPSFSQKELDLNTPAGVKTDHPH
jgi:outer membrane lipoprotein-sorting protein